MVVLLGTSLEVSLSSSTSCIRRNFILEELYPNCLSLWLEIFKVVVDVWILFTVLLQSLLPSTCTWKSHKKRIPFSL